MEGVDDRDGREMFCMGCSEVGSDVGEYVAGWIETRVGERVG